MLASLIDQQRQKNTGILGTLGDVAKDAKGAMLMSELFGSGYRPKTAAIDMPPWPRIDASPQKNRSPHTHLWSRDAEHVGPTIELLISVSCVG
jgi:hypothetical protein